MNAVTARNRLNILVVDDDAMIAMFLDDMLTDLGCTVVGPTGAVASALALIEACGHTLDGALLDVNLRGELAYPIADVLLRRGVPFVFVTGYAPAGINPDYAMIPALSKPFRFETLDHVVQGFAAVRDGIGPAPGPALERSVQRRETCTLLTSQQ
jgi:CheY-like chemotaxis protein